MILKYTSRISTNPLVSTRRDEKNIDGDDKLELDWDKVMVMCKCSDQGSCWEVGGFCSQRHLDDEGRSVGI